MDKKHDEDALDFEAEDGECADEKDEKPAETKEADNKSKKDSDGEIEVSKDFVYCMIQIGNFFNCFFFIPHSDFRTAKNWKKVK